MASRLVGGIDHEHRAAGAVVDEPAVGVERPERESAHPHALVRPLLAALGHRALRVEDAVDRADLAQHALQLVHVPELEEEPQVRDALPVGRDRRRQHVHAGIGERDRDVLQQARPVERLDEDLDLVRGSTSPVSHSTSRMRSPLDETSSRAFGQSARWTDTPRPRVTNPTMSSPGTGLQQ